MVRPLLLIQQIKKDRLQEVPRNIMPDTELGCCGYCTCLKNCIISLASQGMSHVISQLATCTQ